MYSSPSALLETNTDTNTDKMFARPHPSGSSYSPNTPLTPPAVARDSTNERAPTPPFAFNPSVHPTPIGPIYRIGESPWITLNGLKLSYGQKPEPPLKNDAIFFTDPAFKRDIQTFFSFTSPNNNSNINVNKNTPRSRRPLTLKYTPEYSVIPVYKAADDDLVDWKSCTAPDDGAKSGLTQNNTKKLKAT